MVPTPEPLAGVRIARQGTTVTVSGRLKTGSISIRITAKEGSDGMSELTSPYSGEVLGTKMFGACHRFASGTVPRDVVGVAADGKAGVVVGVTDDMTTRFNAVDFVRIAAERLGGKGGGGRPDMAQAGGPDGAAAQSALTAISDALAAKATAA